MEIEQLKNKILEIHEIWDTLGDSTDCFKYGQIHESYVVELISEYCISKGYEVDGFPFKKTDECCPDSENYNHYFCYERYVKYLDVLATQKEDVFELMYFFSSTFWLELYDDKEEYRARLIDFVDCDVYEIDF